MSENKRKSERLNLPLGISFRPTYGVTEYTDGSLINISSEGLALAAQNFSFIRFENLELHLAFPMTRDSLSLSGNVVWKRNTGDESAAGVQFKEMDEEVRDQFADLISSLKNKADDRTAVTGDAGTDIHEESEEVTELKSTKKRRKSAKKNRKQGFTKQYCQGGSRCKVTFRLPAEAAPEARKVTIVGDFNDWNNTKTPMKQVRHGDYLVTLELESNREYRFRYFIDGNRWENDWSADKYIPNDYGTDDSVVIV